MNRLQLLNSINTACECLPEYTLPAGQVIALSEEIAAQEGILTAARADDSGPPDEVGRKIADAEQTLTVLRWRLGKANQETEAGAFGVVNGLKHFIADLRTYCYRCCLFILARRSDSIRKALGGHEISCCIEEHVEALALSGPEYAPWNEVLAEVGNLRRDVGAFAPMELHGKCLSLLEKVFQLSLSFAEEIEKPWPAGPQSKRWTTLNGVMVSAGVSIAYVRKDEEWRIRQVFGPDVPESEQEARINEWAKGNACPFPGVVRIEMLSSRSHPAKVFHFEPGATATPDSFAALRDAEVFDDASFIPSQAPQTASAPGDYQEPPLFRASAKEAEMEVPPATPAPSGDETPAPAPAPSVAGRRLRGSAPGLPEHTTDEPSPA